MADTVYFDKIKLLDGTVAEVCDSVARAAISGGTHFLGVTTTTISDGSATNPITIGEDSVTAKNGDIVAYGNKEFIFASYDSKWHELGDLTGLGALALKNSVSAVYTPAGTISKPNVTVTPTAVGVKEISSDGTVSTGTIKEFSTDGSVSTGTIKELSADGSVVAGSANVPTAVTLPVLTTTLSGTTLELGWSAGSVTAGTAGTPTSVTLPTFKETSVVTAATMPVSKETSVVTSAVMPVSKTTSVLTGVAAELSAAPEFSGTQSTIVSE